MKKVLFLFLAAVTLTACQLKGSTAEGNSNDSIANVDSLQYSAEAQVFEGIIPAADGPGIKYLVALEGDSTFFVTQTYLEANEGKDESQNYTGKAEALTIGEAKGLKLALDADNNIYVKQIDDQTLRLVNDSLQEATSGLNYDLKRK